MNKSVGIFTSRSLGGTMTAISILLPKCPLCVYALFGVSLAGGGLLLTGFAVAAIGSIAVGLLCLYRLRMIGARSAFLLLGLYAGVLGYTTWFSHGAVERCIACSIAVLLGFGSARNLRLGTSRTSLSLAPASLAA